MVPDAYGASAQVVRQLGLWLPAGHWPAGRLGQVKAAVGKSLTVGCPKCQAERGKACVDAKGNELVFTHDERDAWLKELEDSAFEAVVDRMV